MTHTDLTPEWKKQPPPPFECSHYVESVGVPVLPDKAVHWSVRYRQAHLPGRLRL